MLLHCGKDGDLCSTHEDITSLAKQFIEHWKSRNLGFITGKIMFNFVLDVQHPNFSGFIVPNNAQYHRSWHIQYTYYKFETKTQSLLKKKAKLTQISGSSLPLACSISR